MFHGEWWLSSRCGVGHSAVRGSEPAPFKFCSNYAKKRLAFAPRAPTEPGAFFSTVTFSGRAFALPGAELRNRPKMRQIGRKNRSRFRRWDRECEAAFLGKILFKKLL